MFEFIRNNQKVMQFVLLIFIAPAFVLLGVSGYDLSQQGDALAVVGEHSITQEEFDNLKRQEIERARRERGDSFDPAVFDTPAVEKQLLDSLVTSYLLQQSVQDQFLTASNQALQEVISKEPLFQEDGKFNLEKYKRELAARGIDPVAYEAGLRFNLARAQVLDPALQGAFLSKPVKDLVDQAQLVGRVVRTQTIGLDDVKGQVETSDESLKAYFEANQSRFTLPENVDVEYLVLSPDAVKKQIAVSDDDVKQYYEQNKARFTSVETRSARHILMPATGEDASEDELKAKAQKVLDQVKADPSQFASLAKEYSLDTGSAANGGDLMEFRRGVMVPEFEAAAFSLKLDEISDLVRTDFGYHIIQVTGIKGGEVRPFEEVNDELIDEIQTQQLTLKMAELEQTFSEKVYEAGNSFDDLATELGLSTRQFKGLTRAGVESVPALASEELLSEIFSSESIENKNNTKAINVNDTLVSARVVNHRPEQVKAFEDVKEEVRAEYTLDKSIELAAAKASEIVKQLGDQATRESALQPFGKEVKVSALSPNGIPPLGVQSTLNTSVADLPVAKSVGLGPDGYLVVWVESALGADEVKSSASEQMIRLYENIGNRAFQQSISLATRDALSARAGVEINKTFE